ncbi:uncharacterized protein LOC142318786 [Lycorma delicatula]|uniref:uncharacterized protein LOC142318786 n=1 Tax=Lycorma delicatula TaxID=130591 RepID=UPI003F5198F4
MADSDDNNTADLIKMKVADLRRELKSRGLSTVGNKNELIERLQGRAVGEEGVITSGSVGSSGDSVGGSGNVDGDVMDDSGNHEEAELLDEDDVLEDGLDDELSVEGISETNDSSSVINNDSLNLSNTAVTGETRQSKQTSKRKLTTSGLKKSESTNLQPKKITLVRNTSSSMSASEKENQESSDQDKCLISEAKGNESSPPKKIIKLSSFTVKERLELRAQKFGTSVPVSNAAKKEARAIRFGLSSGQTSSSLPVASAEVLKKRAERFGTAVSPILKKTELEEKLKLRQQRFGVTNVSSGGDGSNSSNNTNTLTKATIDEKKRLRAERFKLAA